MYDLIIVGGGPSGASAGRTAGKRGLLTLLIEKEHFPRYKPCGGALSSYGLSCLDFKLPEQVIERNISKVRVHFRDRFVEGVKESDLALLISRKVFDNFLLEKARETGIEVHTGEKVLDCIEKDDHVEVRTTDNTYLGRFVLIAEGSGGTLKYKVRLRDKRTDYGLALTSEIPAEDEAIRTRLPETIDIHFGIAQGGYGWIFPHSGYYSVGIVGTAQYLKHPKKVLLDFLQENNLPGNFPIHSHIIPKGGIKRKIVSSRLLLSGDAAGFVDAFTGEGIAYAIRSGQLAAEAVANLVMYSQKLSSLKAYESSCRKELGNYLAGSLKMEKIMHRFPGVSFKLAVNNSEILDKYLDEVVIGRNYKDYIRWLLLNFCLAEPVSRIKSLTLEGSDKSDTRKEK
ncbi:geranylgeranyl reductase family [Methanosarcina thermophila]|jgi:geranylgeranyl reductase family protein|uniref:geranylgeranyl diphosphate reductase n=3 Tax=Methanosarcina thermophila TaxID=2210 RepID=A0A1I6YL29_METTE|nr:geranylgeranyl reductase family protein [Methanosarcina thermophila]ALK05237.1 MAG: geranylgeranyl reductase [Methanosarcina sp. 795]AKB14006.1 Geranylgeranyl diphosphate reductase [Methanosarcina thermophila TM-1]AKB15350.1 Geranylgeranyl diphosphate reductase [Methanosarcina thermophila CHTI-55]NLU56067.1 geranylgeranyl reductase family protein [Methanosarcina thermophila]SFT51038.1 geranylgeranyl reductase family [Methanosarcina thermophila]